MSAATQNGSTVVAPLHPPLQENGAPLQPGQPQGLSMTPALPLHVQRLQRALDLTGFLNQLKQSGTNVPSSVAEGWDRLPPSLSTSLTQLADESDSETDDSDEADLSLPTDDEEHWPWLDGAAMSRSRRLLAADLLGSSSGSSSEEPGSPEPADRQLELAQLLQQHQRTRSFSRQCRRLPQPPAGHVYYAAGLLSSVDRHPTPLHAAAHAARPLEDDDSPAAERRRRPTSVVRRRQMVRPSGSAPTAAGGASGAASSIAAAAEKRTKKALKQQRDQLKALNNRRRKLWLYIAKKEVGKVQRSLVNGKKDKLIIMKRLAAGCTRAARQRALQSQKCSREIVWRMKRLTREMQTYWRHYSRVERQTRRRHERQQIEQRRISSELLEAKRQQRKLNFLLTQTELYAHFMRPKVDAGAEPGPGGDPGAPGDPDAILGQLDEPDADCAGIGADADDQYDSAAARSLALQHARAAVQRTRQQTLRFQRQTEPDADQTETDTGGGYQSETGVGGGDQSETGVGGGDQSASEYAQPAMFRGTLKEYQLKGMRWLATLFDSGINGILADEMGLGKTVQAIAFLAHLAEQYGVWGPFLVVGPASTLHNWQQELARFCPDLKVVPYWGNAQDRKVLRTFWERRNLATPTASFHVVVTSYQLVVSDAKYLSRIDWQCLVLDEAQAIKSSSSQRWRSLLALRCRSRVLLTGTPVQNSMAELWALLHFIMPQLFDSHREFSEWFSKDIESHAEQGRDIDHAHLSRLHLILKPFMLRRLKCDVENELSDKIEVMVSCPLTRRQRLLYQGLRQKISVDELLRSALGGTQTNQQATTRLLNLVMQFRKVCNHPELFERRPVHSPLWLQLPALQLPRLLFRHQLLQPSSRHQLLHHRLSVHQPLHVQRSLRDTHTLTDAGLARCAGGFSFLAFVDTSAAEWSALVACPTRRWLLLAAAVDARRRRRDAQGAPATHRRRMLLLVDECGGLRQPSPLLFTSHTSTFYTHTEHRIWARPETLQHRLMRSRKRPSGAPVAVGVPEVRLLVSTTKTPVGAGAESSTPTGDDPESTARLSSDCRQDGEQPLPLEFPHRPLPVQRLPLQPTHVPALLLSVPVKVAAAPTQLYCSDRSAAYRWQHQRPQTSLEGQCLLHGTPDRAQLWCSRHTRLTATEPAGVTAAYPCQGWSHVIIPDKRSLIADAGKLHVLDPLLRRLKDGGHRVLIYSQMTRMIDLLEEYMFFRQHKYKRLDGSSKIHERRDMVDDFQNKSDIFVFLLSTRAGGLGINLTAADTVIFYDSDWNPTVDQQAMDRAHRLGQTKQVTVYRLICHDTIEERILQRAREKSQIQRMVIQGGSVRPDQLRAKEVVSLLLDDDVIEKKFLARQAESQRRKRRLDLSAVGPAGDAAGAAAEDKRQRLDADELSRVSTPRSSSRPLSPNTSERSVDSVVGAGSGAQDPDLNNALTIELGTAGSPLSEGGSFLQWHERVAAGRRSVGAQRPPGRRRGRPRGSGRGRARAAQLPGQLATATAAAAESSPAAEDDAQSGGGASAVGRRGRGGRSRGRPGAGGRPRGRPPGSTGSRRPVRLPVPLASSRYFQERHQLSTTGGTSEPGPSHDPGGAAAGDSETNQASGAS